MDAAAALELEPNAIAVLDRRYLVRDRDGNVVETPAQCFHRVAADVAAAEARFVGPDDDRDAVVTYWTRRFEAMLRARRFLPNTPTLMNAGRGSRQLAACFVLPVEDSLDAIFETLKHAALIHKTGGGTGFAFSRIRPRDDAVDGRAAQASGPVSFMAVFDAATEHVKQGGARRGANMAVLRYDHPDIVEFVGCKTSGDDVITNFNISVGVDAAFWDAVEHDRDIALVNPHTGAVTGSIAARALFDRIVDAAWRSGDPGLVFLDRMNRRRTNPTPALGRIEATNPCGEQPLLPFEACNLGSLALNRYVTTSPTGPTVDRDALRDDVHAAVRFLDDVIDRCDYPLAEITAVTRDGNRKIGLGVMGWADLLVELGVPYDSDAAVDLAEELMAFVSSEADAASEQLALARGSFPNWERSVYADDGRPMRNATRTTIAPTGSISIIAGCSSGIEPLFALSMQRTVMDGTTLTETHPSLAAALRATGCDTDEVRDVVRRTGSLHGAAGVPDYLAAVFATAHEIDPVAHVRMQAAFQRHTDNAVSKTVNLAHDATRDDVADVLRAAWREGCLGVTVFRDGCKSAQVLTAGVASPSGTARRPVVPRPVPDVPGGLPTRRFRVPTPLGTMNVFVSELDGDPFEVFLVFGKAGSDVTAMSEAIGRLLSLLLRTGVPVPLVVDQLKGIGGRTSIGFGDERVFSVADAVAKLLEANYASPRVGDGDRWPPTDVTTDATAERDLCPDCGEYGFEFVEGCGKCQSCGFTTC